MWQSVEILNVFNTLTLIQIIWKTKHFFKKLEYRFLVEANVKTTKWTHHKEWSFASNFFSFFEKFVSVLEPLENSLFDVPATQMSISVFFVSAEFNFSVLFPCEYP